MITKEEIYDIIPRKDLVRIIGDFFSDPNESIHGLHHWLRVLANGFEISKHNGANKKIITCFAFFHDIKRERENKDPEHGPRGSIAFLSLKYKVNLTRDEIYKVVEACHGHTNELYHDDVDISTCWDSDRLDLYRVGIIPDSQYLNQEISKEKEFINEAINRSIKDEEEWMVDIIIDLIGKKRNKMTKDSDKK